MHTYFTRGVELHKTTYNLKMFFRAAFSPFIDCHFRFLRDARLRGRVVHEFFQQRIQDVQFSTQQGETRRLGEKHEPAGLVPDAILGFVRSTHASLYLNVRSVRASAPSDDDDDDDENC